MTTLIEICGLPLVHALGWTLLHLCWQGAGVAVGLWCVLKVLDGRSSRARYAASCLALGLMIALPLATFAHLASVEYRLRAALDGPVAIDPGMTLLVGAGELTAPWPMRIAVALDHALPWVLVAWFAGVIFFVGRLNVGLMVARSMRSVATTAAPTELQQAFDALRRRLGVERVVRLMHSALVEAPTVIGWLRPVVLVPASCLTGLSTMQIEAVLAHELAHIRRHDYLVSVLQSVIETLLFYHPAVWWVSKQIRRERECCCDELAVAVGGDRLAYARALSLLEERRSFNPEFVLGANGGVLTMRIKRLLGRTEASAASQLVSIALLAALVLAVGAASYKLAHAQNVTAQTNSSASSTAQVTVEPDARQSAAVSAAIGPANGPPPSLSTAGQQTTSDTERQIESAQWQLQNAQEKLNSEQFKKQIEDAQRWLQNAQAKPNSPEFKKQIAQLLAQNAAAGQEPGAPPKPVAPPVPMAPGGPVRLSSGVVEGMILLKAMPVYPAEAKAAGVQGAVVLHAIISKTGTVESVEVVSGPEELRDSARDAVRQWTYKPYLLNGEPVEVETSITVNYTLADSVVVGQSPAAGKAVDGVRQVGGNVTAPIPIYQPEPEFSAEAKKSKFMGVVTVSIIVDKKGRPQNVHVTKGVGHGLDEKAVEAVKKYRFIPAKENGKPVAVGMNVEVNFEIF